MYNLLAVFVGFLLMVVATLNTGLVNQIGSYYVADGLSVQLGNAKALVIFHVLGVVIAFILLLATRKPLKFKTKLPFYFYTGGAIGYLMVFINSVCITRVGASLTVAVIIFGQMLVSTFIDHLGLFKMKVNKFDMRKISGFTVIILGLCLMVYGS